jgi:hypothetical protein
LRYPIVGTTLSGFLGKKMRIQMRHWFFFILIIGVFSSGLTALAQDDPFLTAETVPFPFTDGSDQETITQNTFTQDVPVPPDTLASTWAENAEGYVPEVYGRTAPEPAPVVLRPRYRSGSTVEKPQKKSSTASSTALPSKDSQEPPQQPPIQQVAASEAPNPPSELSAPIHSQPKTAASQMLKYPISLSPQKKMNQILSPPAAPPELQPQQGPYTVNNTHSCDELTCGDGGCSMDTEKFSFLHLSERKPRYGLCDCCGFLRCVNKTVGHWYYDGWLSAGSFMNLHWPEDRNNFSLHYNDRNGETVMNQLYLTLGRRINPRKGRWDIGGRVDLLYGTDYFYTGSLGLETRRTNYIFGEATLDPLEANLHWNSNSGVRRMGTASLYGLSLPQAYAELFVPFGYGITVKAGHFYSGMGIESAMSPENFFYSHSYSFMYGSPTTLTGAAATVKLGSRFSAVFGFSRGWDVFDKTTDSLSGIAGLEMKSFDKRTSLSFLVHSGEESLEGDNRTNYTLTLRHQLAPRLHYALEHSFGYEKNGALLDYSDNRGQARWYSVAQYLQWERSERFSFGLRGEWFRDDGHSRIQKGAIDDGYFLLQGKDYFQITLGANWKPTRFITIRPEIRYDWSNVVVQEQLPPNQALGIYSNGKKEMVSFAIDGIFRF